MIFDHLFLTSAQIVVKIKKVCNGQELCEYNSLCECNFFMARDKPNILDESTQALLRDVMPHKSAGSLKDSTSIWMGMIQSV